MHYQATRQHYGAAPSQFGDLYCPANAGPHPVVILIHGGYWRARYGLDLMEPLAVDLAARGVATWNIEYRRVGEAGGGWPGTFQDLAAAADYLPTLASAHQLDLTRTVAIGHSAGGQLALWLAARPRLRSTILGSDPIISGDPLPITGVIGQAAVADLQAAYTLKLSNGAVGELLGGTPATVPDRYAATNPAQLLPLGVPQILVHGEQDDTVPIAISRDYAQAAAAAGDVAHFRPINSDHYQLIDPATTAWAAIIGALRELFVALGPLPIGFDQ